MKKIKQAETRRIVSDSTVIRRGFRKRITLSFRVEKEIRILRRKRGLMETGSNPKIFSNEHPYMYNSSYTVYNILHISVKFLLIYSFDRAFFFLFFFLPRPILHISDFIIRYKKLIRQVWQHGRVTRTSLCIVYCCSVDDPFPFFSLIFRPHNHQFSLFTETVHKLKKKRKIGVYVYTDTFVIEWNDAKYYGGREKMTLKTGE